MGNQSSSRVPVAHLEFRKYFGFIYIIWTFSWTPSALLFFYYYRFHIMPDLGIYAHFWPIFADLYYITIALFTPLLLILLYQLRLLMVAILGKLAIMWCNHLNPVTEMIASKGEGERDAKMVSVYWRRGAILRILKWTFAKCPFPWLVPWVFNFVGTDKLGKGTVMEDGFYCPEMLETGENVYIGPGSIVSSHLVEGTYGAITLKKVYIGDGAVLSAFNGVSPGCFIGAHAEIMPISALPKYWKATAGEKYMGFPVNRIGTNHYVRLMHYLPEIAEQIVKAKAQVKGKSAQNPTPPNTEVTLRNEGT